MISDCGVIILNEGYRIIHMNDTIMKEWNLSNSTLYSSIFDLVYIEQSEQAQELIKQVLREQSIYDCPLLLDGEKKYMLRIRPVKFAKAYCVVIAVCDISEYNRWENNTLEEMEETMRDFGNYRNVLLDDITSNIDIELLYRMVYLIDHMNDSNEAIELILPEIGHFYDIGKIRVTKKQPDQQEIITYQWVNEKCGKRENNITQVLTTISCPLYNGDEILGFVEYEQCDAMRSYTKEEITAIQTLTKFVNFFIELIQSKLELERQVFFSNSIVNNQKLMYYFVDPCTYKVLYFTKYSESIYPDIKEGEYCYKCIMKNDEPCSFCPINRLKHDDDVYSVEQYIPEAKCWVQITGSVVYSKDKTKMFFLSLTDITNVYNRIKSIDTLTGLITVDKFKYKAMKLIHSETKQPLMLIYVDIINYANIINQIGYEKRGRLFGILTTKIKETLQSWELCCSHNEKDFILLCAYDEDHSVLKRRFLGCYQAVVKEWKEDEELALVLPKFRAGIYRILKQDSDVNIMIEHAKFAKDYIKQFGSYGFSFFDNQCYERERRRLDIENRMEQALANGEFKLYVQPKVDTKTGIISGGEALIRWQEKNGTIVSPGEFIPIFEENGFVRDLDYFVYNQMFEHLKYWIDVHGTDLIIAVNVSRIHLEEGEFIANLVNIARKHKIPVNQIELEITESAFLEDTDHLKEVLSNLHDIGFHISLDDFGAGYSSLNILQNLTIDILKLDRGFFLNPVPLHKDIVLITSIIDLAHKLGLKVVAEGIETEEYVKLLQKCGCDFIQGYYYYKPMPVEEFEQIAFYDE